jgi:ketosteroid isomerase-like protein
MSQANVAVVRGVFEAGHRRDSATAFALYDEGIVWDVSRLGGADFGEGVFHGHDGIRRWFRGWLGAWDTVRNDVDELIDAGEQVIAITTQTSRGKTSGIEVELKQYSVWAVRDGRVQRAVWFRTREEALEAVGLSE